MRHQPGKDQETIQHESSFRSHLFRHIRRRVTVYILGNSTFQKFHPKCSFSKIEHALYIPISPSISQVCSKYFPLLLPLGRCFLNPMNHQELPGYPTCIPGASSKILFPLGSTSIQKIARTFVYCFISCCLQVCVHISSYVPTRIPSLFSITFPRLKYPKLYHPFDIRS